MFGVELAQGGEKSWNPSWKKRHFNWMGSLGQPHRDGREECVGQGNEQKKDFKAGKCSEEQRGSSVWLVQSPNNPTSIKGKCVCAVSHFSRIWLFVILWTVALQAPLSIGFAKQEYWSGLPFPSPGDIPNPGIKPTSPALAGRFFISEPPGKPLSTCRSTKCRGTKMLAQVHLILPLVPGVESIIFQGTLIVNRNWYLES